MNQSNTNTKEDFPPESNGCKAKTTVSMRFSQMSQLLSLHPKPGKVLETCRGIAESALKSLRFCENYLHIVRPCIHCQYCSVYEKNSRSIYSLAKRLALLAPTDKKSSLRSPQGARALVERLVDLLREIQSLPQSLVLPEHPKVTINNLNEAKQALDTYKFKMPTVDAKLSTERGSFTKIQNGQSCSCANRANLVTANCVEFVELAGNGEMENALQQKRRIQADLLRQSHELLVDDVNKHMAPLIQQALALRLEL